ncbi:MAG: 50S ribosomal protein L24 [Gammaproteobacteria bacterium]|nr:50S ribosomal protein L24 [Gammaproteobacteria bacterium]
MRKIKKNDDVVIMTGKDRGKRGRVLSVIDNQRVIVEGCNMVKKNQRPNPNAGVPGGIIDREMPLHISNVQLYNPLTKKADRAGFKILEDNTKVRVYKSNEEVVDI